MKHKIIKTENYLLVVGQPEEGINPKVKYFDDKVDVNNIYCSTKFLDDNTFEYRFISGINNDYRIVQKIIAHLPLNNSPILDSVDLLPPFKDDVEKLADIYSKNHYKDQSDYWAIGFDSFKRGYNKAKEKYKYTEDDIRNGIVKGFLMGMDREHNITEVIEQIIQSLQQPKIPVGFDAIAIDNLEETATNSQGLTQWVGEWIY